MKIIAGVEQPSAGRLLLDGEDVHFADPAAAARAGVCMVFQELSLFANLSIAENVFIGRERCRLGIDIDRGRSEEHTSELQSLMRISYAVFCLKKKKNRIQKN